MPEQQFQILRMLVFAEGSVVSREEIRKRLWPNDTVVEFDRSINTAIMKLRIALGDTGDKARLIETLPRRGYRLMVPVEQESPEVPGPSNRVNKPGSLVGQRVSHYRVLDILGGGGMGVVYKALDLKLDRPVAIKFLPEELGEDQKAIARFEGEARAVSALDHPNICSIFEFGEQESLPFIVMPLLDGRNLRDILADDSDLGRLFPFQQILDFSVQIVSGLQAAHDEGIIHRDIKPANIFITQRGVAKILDFGIAKMIPVGESGEGEAEDSPSSEHWIAITATDQTLTLTRTGIAVGSAGYMSPEQVRGEKLDARTDLFSFGLVLYEMATGQRAFTGDTAAIVQNAILNQNPILASDLNRDLPNQLEMIIARALEKDRDLRYGSAGEMLADLKGMKQATNSAATRRSRKRIWLSGGTVAAVLLLIVALVWYFKPGPIPKVTGSTQLTYGADPSYSVATDGSRLYFRANRTADQQLVEMSVAGGEVTVLPVPISHPVIADISPDHSQLLISTSDDEDDPLWTLPLPSGSPHRLGDIEVNGASWAPDGKHLLVTRGAGVYITAPDGSDMSKVVSVAEGTAQCAGFSPDGSRIRFGVINRQVDAPTLWEVRSDGSGLHQLLPGWRAPLECGGNWTPDGRYFVFGSETGDGAHDIFAMRESQGVFSKSAGTPVRLTFGPLKFEAPVVSPNGKKLFVYGWHQRGELVHYDSASGEFVPFLGGISAERVSFSRDGKWVAYNIVPGYDLWRSRADGSERVQLTPPIANTRLHMPIWSPDGKQIAVMSEVAGSPWKILLISADGGSPKPLLQQNNPQLDPTWSADGGQIAYATGEVVGTAKSEIQTVNVQTHEVSIIPGSSGKCSPRWSPDGRYLAALSFEVHPTKIFLYDFHARKWTEWATGEDVGYPSWTADSRYLEYVERNSGYREPTVRRVKVGDSHPEDRFSLKGLRRFDGIAGPWSDIAPDGSRMFLRDASGRDIYALDVEFP